MALFIGLLLLLIQPFSVFAAGRVQIEAQTKSGPAGKPLEVKVKLLQGDAPDSQPSTGEKAEFKITDPKDGQTCTTNPAPSDSQGYVYGSCVSEKDVAISVYAVSKDRGDASETVTLTFTQKEGPSPTIDPKRKQAMPNQQQQANAGSALTNQPGLAEDPQSTESAPMEGLQTANDAPAVAGASTTQQTTAPATSDIDLLNSLIYLTGGIILLIAGIYFIYVQSKQVSMRKKEKELPPQAPPDAISKT
ncbi:hypothetical protein HYS00_02330 [Candidatus Microgenomates bacterium]|nr:hypothetical protein [Candidatus Microgenomates bacterium]